MSPITCLAVLVCVQLTLSPLGPGSESKLEVSAADVQSFVFVTLETGPQESQLSAAEVAAASRGHFENIDRLQEEGVLLLAGPYAAPQVDLNERGIFIFDVETIAAAQELTRTDPAVKAGVFSLVAQTMETAANMGSLPALHRGFGFWIEAHGGAVGRDVRSYVLASSTQVDAAEDVMYELEEEGRVLFSARVGAKNGGEAGAGVIFLLDVQDLSAGQELLDLVAANSDTPIDFVAKLWYGSNALIELPRLTRYPAGPTFDVVETVSRSDLELFHGKLERVIDVFGVHVLATTGTGLAQHLHAAHVMAQYIDNDEDGVPDDERAHAMLLAEGAFLIMSQEEGGLEQLDLDWESLERAGFRIGQDLYGEETHPNSAVYTRKAGPFDAALEEVWHLVSAGYCSAYPGAFSYEPGSRLTDAMDLARGGRFERIPAKYPAGAWYSYDDRTCDYECMAAEYFYWTLTSLLDGQSYDGRADEIDNEWRLPTPAKLAEGDPKVFALLTDAQYKLPRKLPDGGYRRD